MEQASQLDNTILTCTPCRARVGGVEKFGADGGQLAYQKKGAGFNQENCYRHAALQSAHSMAGLCRPQPEPTVAENSGAGGGTGPRPPRPTSSKRRRKPRLVAPALGAACVVGAVYGHNFV